MFDRDTAAETAADAEMFALTVKIKPAVPETVAEHDADPASGMFWFVVPEATANALIDALRFLVSDT